jgi:acetyltransferase-like isoleucine patch superfamily enzyme
MNGYNGIKIAKKVMFASGVKIISANHDFNNRKNHIKGEPIIIEENVWIGTNAIILPEVRIGKNSIIGGGCCCDKRCT